MLKKSLENERSRVNLLNEQLFQLNQKLYETELNDSLDAPRFNEALHIRIETKTKRTQNGQNSNNANINNNSNAEQNNKVIINV